MSPSIRPIPPEGRKPGERIDIRDIQSKLEEIRGDTDETAEKIKPKATVVAVAAVVVVIGVAFLLGRRRGRRKSTWVEIRRQ